MRISAEERYCPNQWQHMTEKFRTAALTWAKHLLSTEENTRLHDLFNFFGDEKKAENGKSKHSTIWALWRVDVEMIPNLLALSGRAAEGGIRFFIEPIRWVAPAPSPARCPYKEWKRNKDENWPDYADRVYAACDGLGVARGEKALAPREVRDDSDDARRRRWRIEQVPASHTYADMAAILADNGLRDVVFEGKAPAPKVAGSSLARRTWWVRAVTDSRASSFCCVQTVGHEDVELIGYVEADAKSNRKSALIVQGTRMRFAASKLEKDKEADTHGKQADANSHKAGDGTAMDTDKEHVHGPVATEHQDPPCGVPGQGLQSQRCLLQEG